MVIYEVTEGSSSNENRFTGLILRDEKLIQTSEGGYVLPYQRDGARVAKNTPLFSMNSTLVYQNETNSDKHGALTQRDIAQVKHEIKSFYENFSDTNFTSVYQFQDNIGSTMIEIGNNNLVASSNQQSGEVEGADQAFRSQESGIIVYYKDEYETITTDLVNEEMWNKENYKRTNLRTTDKINSNSPVCKIIRSEDWNLVLLLKKEQYDKLKDKKNISITVVNDGMILNSELKTMVKGTSYYAVLTFHKNMSNYIAERYLEVELKIDEIVGLKIPPSALVNKDFYEVPSEYFSKGGNSNDTGLLLVEYAKDGSISYPFVPIDISYQTEEFGYIDSALFTPGTKIQLAGKKDQYTLSKTLKMAGVYSVNQGYAVFKRVEMLYQTGEYCIIKKDTKNGLSEFDHIALDSGMAVEQKIIY